MRNAHDARNRTEPTDHLEVGMCVSACRQRECRRCELDHLDGGFHRRVWTCHVARDQLGEWCGGTYKIANFRGLMANTGSNAKQMTKQARAAKLQAPNTRRRSHLLTIDRTCQQVSSDFRSCDMGLLVTAVWLSWGGVKALMRSRRPRKAAQVMEVNIGGGQHSQAK